MTRHVAPIAPQFSDKHSRRIRAALLEDSPLDDSDRERVQWEEIARLRAAGVIHGRELGAEGEPPVEIRVIGCPHRSLDGLVRRERRSD